jgi:hypothetical protein
LLNVFLPLTAVRIGRALPAALCRGLGCASSSGWRSIVVTKNTSSARSPTVATFAFWSATRCLAEDFGDLGTTAGTVARDELDHRTPVRRVARDGDLDGRREHPHLPRRAARDLERLLLPAVTALSNRLRISSSLRRSVIGAAVALEHAVGVEPMAVASGTMRASTIVSPSSSSTAVARMNGRVSSREYIAIGVSPRYDDVVHVDDDRAGARASASTRVCHAIFLRPMPKEILFREARPDVLPAIARQTGLRAAIARPGSGGPWISSSLSIGFDTPRRSARRVD